MLTNYLQALLINLFLIIGIWKLFQPDMLLGKQGNQITDKLGEAWSKPLINCVPCMTSVWGTAFFFLARLYEYLPWWTWPFHCLILCGLATLAMMIENEH